MQNISEQNNKTWTYLLSDENVLVCIFLKKWLGGRGRGRAFIPESRICRLVLIMETQNVFKYSYAFIPIQDGGAKKAPYRNVETSPKNFLIFSCNPFATLL